ncbi:MAG: ATP-binding cassette domain-containing protein [Deltaproteobacteria bacterium]|jgi:ATP-binding cassette subfamily F protein 3|nr:ATP-binding cassette domain-containing protein [Deltaproteobacteria bacterium]
MPLVSFSNVSRFYDRQDVLSSVTLAIEPSDRIGLVGRNGAGKTTIIRLIIGDEQPDAGQVTRQKDLKLGYLPQDVMAHFGQKLLELVLDTDPRFKELEDELKEIDLALCKSPSGQELIDLTERQSVLLHDFEALGGWTREAEAKKILSGLGFTEDDFNRPLTEFSGGWVMRAVLARLLVSDPDLLILDEPTNHLDLDSLMWLEGYLKASKSALLLVSHDRVFLNNVAQKIVELRNARADLYPGNYEQYLAEKARRLVTESAAFANQQDRIKQMEKFIERNKARASTAKRAQSRVKALEKLDRLPQPDDGTDPAFSLNLPRGRRGPDVVAELKHVSKSYGPTIVYRDLNLTLQRGQRLALLGPNGRGKSTLVKLIAGLTAPSTGVRKIGQNVDLGYFSQFQMETLKPDNNLIEELSTVSGSRTPGALRNILGGFLFSGDDVFKKVSVLSGGEKTRLVLAKIMMTAPNLLIMDEPTNHLDIPGRQMLEDALEEYDGTLVIISHDRHFINRLCSQVGVIEEGKLTVYPGNFDDYRRLWLGDLSDLSGQKNPTPKTGAIEMAGSVKAGPNPTLKNEQTKNEQAKTSQDKTSQVKTSQVKPDQAKSSQTKFDRLNDRKEAQEAKKREAARRRPLLKTLEETEKRLTEISDRCHKIEMALSESSIYRDSSQARDLTLELANLREEKGSLEDIWEKTAAQLERE